MAKDKGCTKKTGCLERRRLANKKRTTQPQLQKMCQQRKQSTERHLLPRTCQRHMLYR